MLDGGADRDRDHVLGEVLAVSNSRIATRSDDVDQTVLNDDLDPYPWVGFQEPLDHRREDVDHHGAGCVQSQLPLDLAVFDREVVIQAAQIAPMVSWGTSPDQAGTIDDVVPDPETIGSDKRAGTARALEYMGLAPGTPLSDITIDRAFIGSCTNARLSDLRDAARVLRGRRVAAGVRAMISPGSSRVRREAEAEGLDRVYTEAGFEWRQSGCSMCLAMNDDVLAPGERCSTSPAAASCAFRASARSSFALTDLLLARS